jgi:hypothetical protein
MSRCMQLEQNTDVAKYKCLRPTALAAGVVIVMAK